MAMVKEKRNFVYRPGQNGDFRRKESFLGLYAEKPGRAIRLLKDT